MQKKRSLLLVKPGDEEGLKAAVLRLASDASLRAQLVGSVMNTFRAHTRWKRSDGN